MELRELAYGNSHNSLIFEYTFIVYQFCCCCFASSTLSTQARIAWIIILYCIWVNTLHIFGSSDSLANIESIKYIKISSCLSGTPVTCIFKLFGSKFFHIQREFSTKLTLRILSAEILNDWFCAEQCQNLSAETLYLSTESLFWRHELSYFREDTIKLNFILIPVIYMFFTRNS